MRVQLSSAVCTGIVTSCSTRAAVPNVKPPGRLVEPCLSPRRCTETREGLSVASWRMTTSATHAMAAGTTIRTASKLIV